MIDKDKKVQDAVDTMHSFHNFSIYAFRILIVWILFSTIEFFIRHSIDDCFLINVYRQNRLLQAGVIYVLAYLAGMKVAFKISLDTMTTLTEAIKEIITHSGGVNNDR